MKRTPLRRKTPLRSTKALQRQAMLQPRKAVDPSRWTAWRNNQREVVKKRSWRCESIEPCMEFGRHVHHVFGRLGEPWASSQLITLLLCLTHHDRAHADMGFRDRLRMLALTRLAFYLGQRIPAVKALSDFMVRTDPPRATYEWLTTIAESAGIWPPDWKE